MIPKSYNINQIISSPASSSTCSVRVPHSWHRNKQKHCRLHHPLIYKGCHLQIADLDVSDLRFRVGNNNCSKKDGNKPYKLFNLRLNDLERNPSDGKVHGCIVKIKVFIEFLFKLQALQHKVHDYVYWLGFKKPQIKSTQIKITNTLKLSQLHN